MKKNGESVRGNRHSDEEARRKVILDIAHDRFDDNPKLLEIDAKVGRVKKRLGFQSPKTEYSLFTGAILWFSFLPGHEEGDEDFLAAISALLDSYFLDEEEYIMFSLAVLQMETKLAFMADNDSIAPVVDVLLKALRKYAEVLKIPERERRRSLHQGLNGLLESTSSRDFFPRLDQYFSSEGL